MPELRYRLIDGQLLRRLMRCPDVDGTRHTVRSLAAASGVGKSKLHSMINDRQTEVGSETATAIALAVGVRRKALFTPILSASADTDMEGARERGRTKGPGKARCTHQLGEHH